MTHDSWNTIKVLAINIGAITITAANIQIFLSIASFTLASSYTIWKWRNDMERKKANLRKHYDEKN